MGQADAEEGERAGEREYVVIVAVGVVVAALGVAVLVAHEDHRHALAILFMRTRPSGTAGAVSTPGSTPTERGVDG